MRAGNRSDQAQRRDQAALGKCLQGVQLIVLDDEVGQLGWWTEQDRHHTVVTGQPAHEAGVAVDSCRHGHTVAAATDIVAAWRASLTVSASRSSVPA